MPGRKLKLATVFVVLAILTAGLGVAQISFAQIPDSATFQPPKTQADVDALFEQQQAATEKRADSCGIGNLGRCVREFFDWGTHWLLWLLFSLVQIIITFASSFIQFLIQLNGDVLGASIIIDGFAITLALANLGFVLAIIIIAFATILRFEKYELKKTLSRLIIAALLVNFSLVIAGLFIDFTNVLAYFFTSRATLGGLGDFGTEMAQAFNLSNLIAVKPDASTLGSLAGVTAGFLAVVFSLILGVVFGAIVAIYFIAVAFMFLVRYVVLAFLIILMPIAWLLWTIPDFAHLWNKWWNQFLRWCFFAPIVTFFLYLALAASTGVDETVQKLAPDTYASAAAAELFILNREGIPNMLGLLVKIGIFFGGLFAANAMSIIGAKTAMGFAKKAGGWGARAMVHAPIGTARLGYKAASAPVKSYAEKNAEKLQEVGANYRGFWGRLATRPIRALGSAGEQRREAKLAAEKKKMKGRSLQERGRRFADLNSTQQTQTLLEAVKAGKVGDINSAQLGSALKSGVLKKEMERRGKGKEFKQLQSSFAATEQMLNLAEGTDIEALKNETVKFYKDRKPGDAKKQSVDIFKAWKSESPYGDLSEAAHNRLQNASIEAVIASPSSFAQISQNLSGSEFEIFLSQVLGKSLPPSIAIGDDKIDKNAAIQKMLAGDRKVKQALLKEMRDAQKDNLAEALNKTMGNRLTGMGGDINVTVPPAST